MKKGLLTLATVALAFSVFAQDAPKPAEAPKPAGVTISANVKGGIMWVRHTSAIKPASPTADNSKYDFIDTRMRPWFIISNGDTKAVLGLEIDGHMGAANAPGSTATSTDTKYNTNYIPQNGDRTNIEVNECYYETKVKAVNGLTVTGGLLEYKFPVYNFGDQNSQFKVGFKDKMIDAKAIYMRWVEGAYNRNADNSHVWIADLGLDLGVAKVRPAVFYVKSGKDAEGDDRYISGAGSTAVNGRFAGKTAMIYGINFQAKASMLTVTGTFLYGSGEAKRRADVYTRKYSGYAGKFEVAADVSPLSVKAFLNLTSGDKKYTDTKALEGTRNVEYKYWQALTFDTVGDGNTFILEDKGHSLMTDGKPSRMRVREGNPWGFMIYGIQADAKVSDLKLKMVIASGQLSAVGAATATQMKMEKDLGIEFDLQCLYTLGAGTDLVVEGAFLKTGKAHETAGTSAQGNSWSSRATTTKNKTQNVTYIGLGTKYGF